MSGVFWPKHVTVATTNNETPIMRFSAQVQATVARPVPCSLPTVRYDKTVMKSTPLKSESKLRRTSQPISLLKLHGGELCNMATLRFRSILSILTKSTNFCSVCFMISANY